MAATHEFESDNLLVVAAAAALGNTIHHLDLASDGRRVVFTMTGPLPADFPFLAHTSDAYLVSVAKIIQTFQAVQSIVFQSRRDRLKEGR